jgi:hypothetical protein
VCFFAVITLFWGISYAQEVIVVPRLRRGLPSTSLERPELSKESKKTTLPFARMAYKGTDTERAVEIKPPQRPPLISTIGTEGRIAKEPADFRRAPLKAGKFFYVIGRVRNMGWVKVRLYRKRGGFFELYGNEAAKEELGTDYLDSEGNFRIGPLRYKEGFFERGQDVVLVMELDSPYAVAYSEVYGTVRPFRFRLASRPRVIPEGGSYDMGTINIDWKQREYYPVRAYKKVIARLREREELGQKIRIEFTRDVDNPRYMEEIGYILMPYSEQ